MGYCCREDKAVKDLVRGAEKVEFTRGKTFWDAKSVNYCADDV
jgi:hypothetical protein